MKLVEFTRDMSPHKLGETRAVPDDLADRLVGAGDAVVRPSVFDHQAEANPPAAKRRRIAHGAYNR